MTDKHGAHAALEGRPGDRLPVKSLYHYLRFKDHSVELTGRPEPEPHRRISSVS